MQSVDTVLTTLNDTLTELKRQVAMHEAIVEASRDYVKSTKVALDKAEEELNSILSEEKQNRAELDNFQQFLSKEPNGGTPAMQTTLAELANEVSGLTHQLAPLRRKVLMCREKYTGANGAVSFNEERLEKFKIEHRQVAGRIRELASEN